MTAQAEAPDLTYSQVETTLQPSSRGGATPTPAERVARIAAKGQRGMTLLEIMIVLAIIALVMGFLVGPRVLESFREAKEDTARAVLKQFAYEAYPRWERANTGKRCPAELSELLKWMNKKDTKDPWGGELQMFCGDNMPQGLGDASFGVASMGPDGKPNTADDIKSWDD